MRALVVDDSRSVRIVIGKILRELGMDVLEAGNGRQALAQLAGHPDIELLLVDWNMPEMDGFELVRAVRAERDYHSVRILMVTAETEADHVSMALGAGANEYLMKPFDKEILVAKLSLLDVLGE